MRALLPALLATALLLASFGATAQLPGLAGKSWDGLTAAQREVLAPLASQWGQMDASSRDTWAALALRYPRLEANEQERLRERMRDWAALSPAERQRVHQGFLAAQRISAAERQAKWARYQALPAEQRQALQERAAQRSHALPTPATPGSAPARRPGMDRLDTQTLLPRPKQTP
ncbi:MAG: DUF3106 domain-containing protein [Burkholderiales bacterium]|uniref:DUF3106 domain-containing protein n=1 Tax=Inhella sp. TaxID=1921806 RepID=UPI001AC93C8F|nr:DUF3106 domain-containing protein [Burkholderiales bacterium]